ncbi:zf-DHHC-domain-containing protein [Hypoxylon fragiforme]|uniref:zf-DHHC-domain-containing protein n=1 Tax=Hypoxylon fragiforme TaxID=63214 RepID=UPI0020C5DD1F|nr:zf-DHHC-domain-containing protein [Hypoxylon fragiforme]KAI2604500.1 zf-DHHC-domain-containing protein [Hypoxylon fragiforme]
MAFFVGGEPGLQRLFIPGVCLLIAFLAYTSQWLFANSPDLSPGPLTTAEKYTFNTLLGCLWYTYYKACTVDPGRYVYPPSLKKKYKQDAEEGYLGRGGPTTRWCKKCIAPKPPRAHHCKTCRRCIPKMDHHCPWTGNCVSLQTFPHFMRFLLYTNLSLWMLLYLQSMRFIALYESRHLPAYLGPTLTQLAMLTVLTLVAGMTSLALGILLLTTLKGLIFNTTTIESWEIERHESALERRYASSSDGSTDSWWLSNERAPGGDISAPHLALEPVEFPYDIGIFTNIAAGMGTRNFLLWAFPFAGNPTVAPHNGEGGGMEGTGWAYEENCLNDREGMWPPVDPEKIRNERMWRARARDADGEIVLSQNKEDFLRRQQQAQLSRLAFSRSRMLEELEEVRPEYSGSGSGSGSGSSTRQRVTNIGGRKKTKKSSGWTNADGERLADFGVDSGEELDYEDDDDVPLAQLIRKRKRRVYNDDYEE